MATDIRALSGLLRTMSPMLHWCTSSVAQPGTDRGMRWDQRAARGPAGDEVDGDAGPRGGVGAAGPDRLERRVAGVLLRQEAGQAAMGA